MQIEIGNIVFTNRNIFVLQVFAEIFHVAGTERQMIDRAGTVVGKRLAFSPDSVGLAADLGVTGEMNQMN
jgi:hypothetical protein